MKMYKWKYDLYFSVKSNDCDRNLTIERYCITTIYNHIGFFADVNLRQHLYYTHVCLTIWTYAYIYHIWIEWKKKENKKKQKNKKNSFAKRGINKHEKIDLFVVERMRCIGCKEYL